MPRKRSAHGRVSERASYFESEDGKKERIRSDRTSRVRFNPFLKYFVTLTHRLSNMRIQIQKKCMGLNMSESLFLVKNNVGFII